MNPHDQHSRSKGKAGEQLAFAYLLQKGFRIRARNYQTRLGELDCIAEAADGTVVFVEVKSSRFSRGIHPAFWVNRAKQKQLARMATLYCAEHDMRGRGVRFDVVMICEGRVEHIQNAFLVG